MKGRQNDLDEHGKLNKEGKKYCLPPLLNQCADFMDETTEIEHMVQELGVVDTGRVQIPCYVYPKMPL